MPGAQSHDSSIARSLRILEYLATAREPPTHAELSRALGIPKSTLTARMRELRELGYVAVNVDGNRFRAGPGLLSLGHLVSQRMISGLAQAALRPVLEQLARDTGESVALAIEIGGHEAQAGAVLAIDHVHGGNPIRFVGDIGLPVPMYRSAAGRALLAFSNRSARTLPPETLVKATRYTLVDPDAIDEELARTRERGYALSVEEFWEGVVSIAAPVTEPGDTPMAVISVTGVAQRMMPAESAIWPALRNAVATARRFRRERAL